MAQDPERPTRDEFYPKVGDPAEKLRAVVPPFHQEFIDAAVRAAKESRLGVTLTFRSAGENPHEQIVEMHSEGDQLIVEISGDWNSGPEVPQGSPILTNYDGKFFRRENPQALGPIANDGDILEPTKPMVIGIASARKGQYWVYELDPALFPNGARISKFLAPDIKDGLDVIALETILCFVVPL